MASPVIQLQSVSMQFGSEQILNNIDLTVYKSEILVIVGPSGQGKSTLLRILAGLLPPSSGQVFINGEDFYKLDFNQQDARRKKMGMLFQRNALFDSMTVFDNVAFPLRETTNKTDQEILQRVSHFLKAVEIEHAQDLFPNDLSGGMQKRLGIARALALDPDIIFYDDPTAGLDPITSKKIVELILQLNRLSNSTAIAITNEMNRAYQLADKIGLMVKGELILTGSAHETQNHQDPRVKQFIRGELGGPLTEPG